jgi:hypothetical protein
MIAARKTRLTRDEYKGKVDVGIITIREDEFAAILRQFKPDKHIDGESRYEVARVPTCGRWLIRCRICACPRARRESGAESGLEFN